MNILYCVHRYMRIKQNLCTENPEAIPKRVVIFSGKTCHQDLEQNMIITLIVQVSEIINKDKDIQNILKVIYLPNYNVSVAEQVLPSCDILQNLTAPGTSEVSGTCTMKALMNGALLLTSKWGTNLEIEKYYREEMGLEEEAG